VSLAPAPAPKIIGRERPSDRDFMRQALAIGARNLGRTAPNPSVGAILVDERASPAVILARAVTAPGGRPHAERIALDAAGERARGATLFATLEPCAHHGKTPPCAEAVVGSRVGRVVCGVEDPDARVAGNGFGLIREAGIELTVGVLGEECRKLHAGHIMRVTAGRPHVTLKLAMTQDGFVAPARPEAASPHRLLITGAVANAQTHLLRARSDAILVGVRTVLADDPELTCRLPGLAERSPLRVVLDSQLRTPLGSKLVRSARETPTLILTADEAPREAEARLADAGVEITRIGTAAQGLLDLDAALKTLGARGVTLLLCEGGPKLAEELARRDLVDEAVLITGARALGEAGLSALGPALEAAISERHLLAIERLAFGDDLWVRYER
jgi:diaminohydroxyphosphoribosylaminopyrimidine deaminase/5-amino-6-(5-phosphoribosylamino)uracil reductase